MKSILGKLEDKVLVGDGCWPWIGSLWDGYGVLDRGPGKSRKAHRAVYELLVGAIPEGATLDHLCRNPRCVRPDHLEAVTHRENVLRGSAPAAANARKRECPQGHPYDEANTRWWRNKRYCRKCGRVRGRAAMRAKRASERSTA